MQVQQADFFLLKNMNSYLGVLVKLKKIQNLRIFFFFFFFDFFFCVVLMFPNVPPKNKKMDRGVGVWGLTNSRFSRILGLFLT